jgi:hypothetical protein
MRPYMYCILFGVSNRCVNMQAIYIATTINMYSWQRLSLLTKEKLTVVPQSPLSPRLCNTTLLNLRVAGLERDSTPIWTDWLCISRNVTNWSIYKGSINCKEYRLVFCVLHCNISSLFAQNTGLHLYHCVTSAQPDISGNCLPLPYRRVTPTSRYNQVQYGIEAESFKLPVKLRGPNHLPYVATWWRQRVTLIHLHVFH